ncbi:MAG TPA: hypothetical protein PLT65_03055 [Bacilli bacterium]|nr:hypothetical protein [Bacilli bacterium]
MKKLKRLVFDYRMRIISVIFIFAVLTTCVIAYLRTYSEYVSNPNNLNGVIGNTIYINDADEDWYYYMGQNYTYSSDGTLPTFADKGIYDDTNLVETQITYSGTDVIYEDTGYTSLNERQSNYVYYKYYPVYDNGTESTSDDYILIELIDNPYTDRPDDLGFNGWITSYQGVTTSYDSVYYERYAKVPVTYASGKPSKITITFNASWTIASVGTMTNSWNNAFSGLKDAGMATITVSQRVYDYNYDMSDYYTQTTIARYEYYEGYYDYYGTLYTSGSGYCTSLRGCTVYEKMTGQIYNSNTTYYEVSSGYMQVLNHSTIPFSYSDEWAEPFESTTNMAGFYRAETISYNSSLIGYYDSNGNALSGTCGSTTCTYYKLIQYYNSNNDLELAEMNKTYYYLVTRDTNIIYMTSNVSGSWDNYTKPFTLTSLHNGTKANITWTTSSAAVNCYADTRIENLTINDGRGYAYNTSPTNYTGRIKYIYGNYYNLKIGRGIAQSGSNGTAVAVIGGDNNATGNSTIGSASNPKKYKLIIESGFYSSLAMTNGASGNTSYHNTIYVAAKAIYGNDYDRIINNNDGLIVYYCASGSWRGQYRSTSNTTVMFDLILKSGQYGSGKYDDTAGIYVGGRMGGTHYAAKRAKIEGGVIYSLIGGPLTASSQADYNDTYIAVTGGTIDMIIGGAGQTATYGNRLVQVTGGTINYSVFGGSNGSNGSSGDGTVNGDSFIYIGGVAIVGDSTLVLNNSTLHGAEAGSIFGIGNGNSSNSTIGSSDNSYVVIADSAIVRRSVYGGGNYGATGVSSSSNITTTEIKIIGGSINDSVYGGGNNNGSGSSSKTSTINIEMTGGTVSGSVYGGSNIDGTVYGSSTVNIYGGTVSGSVYGGGKGGNTYSSGTDGTYVSGTTSVTVGHASITTYTGPTVSGSIYGGSAYGTVGGTASNNTYTNNDTSVTVNRGTITGSVFGGGQGSSTYTPYVKGDVVVDINGGTIGNVYGGCDLAGSPSGTVQVYIDGGTVSDCVYGGGNQAGVDSTYVYLRGGTVSGSAYGGSNAAGATTTRVYLQGSTVTDIYGGSNASGIVTTSNVTTSSGTVGTIYGGNKSGGSTTTTNITTNGGNITTIYGGGKGVTGGNGTAASAGITHVTLNSAANTITAVYGGGESSNAIETHVTLAGASVTTIYGGSDITGTVGESNVSVSSGTAGTIYGGNNAGGTTTNTNVITTGGTITNVYGGGKGVVGGTGTEAYSSTTNVSLTSTAILGSVYGGGSLANVTGTTSVGISSSNVAGNVYGGGDEASVGSNVTLSTSGSTINGTIYGGGNQAAVAGTITSIISNTNVGANVYGGGDEGASNSSVSLTINNNSDITGSVYGGGNQAGVTGIITTSITGSTIDVDVYGGGNAGAAGSDTSLTINTSTISGSTYGGGYGVSATVAGDALIGLTSTNVVGNVYGGGNAGTIGETVTLTTTDSTVGGSIYGGGNQAAVTGVITSTISNTDVGTNVYGGGNAGASNSNVSLTINNGSDITGSVYGGGNQAAVAGTITSIISNTNVGANVYGGGNEGASNSSVSLTINNGSDITGSVYGGGNQAGVTGIITTSITGSTIDVDVYGGGNAGAAGSDTSLTINTSTISGSTYGGGYGVSATVAGDALIGLTSTNVVGNVYGGGNAGTIGETVTLTTTDSTVGGSIYGGGNQAAVTGVITSTISNTDVGTNVYGGGNAGASNSNVSLTINNGSDITGSVYGGGYGVSATVAGSTDVDIIATNVTENIYGGGNAGVVSTGTNLFVSSGTITGSIYGGGNQAAVNGTVVTTISGTTVGGNIYGGGNEGAVNASVSLTINTSSSISGSVYGGGDAAVVTGTATTNISNTTIDVDIYGGGNAANVNGAILTTVAGDIVGGSIYGGGNEGASNSTVALNVATSTNVTGSVYGGGNQAAVIGSATTNILNSTVGVDVYGGGNAGAVGGNVTLNINNATISGSAYGGGYGVSAAVAGSVDFDLLSSNVTIDVFGGGNAGTVAGSTDLYVSSDIIGGNVYGGGNGATAIVTVNNLLNIDGTTIISGSAYGGGNAAATGNQLNNNSSIGIINVAGAQIAGDVYGGAKTSKLYGTAYTNIGINAVSTTGLISDDISITGTVYGGGDAKPAGSDEYTFNFLSVTNGTVVTIDGLNHTNFSIDGSLFGSGNNSSVDGGATLYIKNYGTLNNCKYNISIQRATVAVIDNSCIEIEGAADRTQELKDTPYTFSLIDDLTIKNNTTLYLQTITNKLASFTSAVDVNGSEVLSAVDIDSNTGEVTRNTNNRLYIWAGENVNISPDAFVDTVTGPVFGMTFFGRYDHDRDNNIYSAYYDNSVEAGDTATTGELNYFSEGSYVKGLHKRLPNYTEQDITVDGFYTNQEDKDNPGVIETIYVEPELVGQNQEHYIWTIGEGVTKLTVDLTASKYSTLGGQALTLDSFYKANTTFTILGFYYNDFDSNASLINSSTIPRIASTSTIADNNMGLVMMTGTNGWLNSGTTEYFTNNSNPYTGTTYYESDNSAIAPTLYFYLYHSKNLGSDADMGTVTISLLVVTPDNLIESIVQRVNIEVSISRVLITENYYDAAITSGQQYEMFVTTPTSINAKSSFSTYYSLYSESTSTIYQNGYYRALTSNYALPENTRITMIDYYDMSNPEYYYYVVTASDEAAALTEISQQGEASYNLSSFIQMGSINTGSSTTTYHYDDATKNALYYDSNTGVAMEEFIFIIDLSETNIATNHSNLSLLIDLRRVFNGSVVSVMGVNNEIARLIVYNLYANSGATINVASSLTPSTVYLGDNSTLNVTTDFVLATVGGTTVQDTRYYDQKLGLKITFFNENGDQINGYDLMGVALQYNGIDHYPRIDGSYRINIANRVANASSNITVRSINSNLSSGVYTINVEAFGSPDGIYYGDISPSSATPIDLTVINSLYGLKVSLASNSKIINKTTGLTLNDNNVLVFYFNYSSGLSSPQIRMHLERRDYTNIYSTMYNDVNLQDYVTNNLIPVGNAEDYQYLLVNNPGATFNMMLYLDTDLVSGTYKFVFSLYENGSYIGDVEEYVVIK